MEGFRGNARSQNMFRHIWIAGIALVCMSGCGAGSGEPSADVGGVTGVVTFKGQPVTEGQVVFQNIQLMTNSVSNLDSSGKYHVTGAPKGNYVIAVRPVPPESTMDKSAPAPKPADPENIPKKFRDSKTSGLTVEITDSKQTFDITLTP